MADRAGEELRESRELLRVVEEELDEALMKWVRKLNRCGDGLLLGLLYYGIV